MWYEAKISRMEEGGEEREKGKREERRGEERKGKERKGREGGRGGGEETRAETQDTSTLTSPVSLSRWPEFGKLMVKRRFRNLYVHGVFWCKRLRKTSIPS